MSPDDLQRFAEDMADIGGLKVAVELATKPDSLHILQINGIEYFFRADGSGYDGWGMSLAEDDPQRTSDKASGGGSSA